MRTCVAVLSLATVVAARETLQERTLPTKGGWSLSMPAGSSCPGQTATCFSDQTGVSEIFNRTGVPGTFDRGQECCPSGTTPRLDCGTYVNNGQPYACCPLGNADCRGDVEDPSRNGNEQCANSGWALWQIPDGDYNMFCCLPGWYGYWDKTLGQDAVGQCQISNVLPEGMIPGVQFNNGDGSVDSGGTQVSALPVSAPTPAPVCDIVHYGWSLQVEDASGCTTGSSLCSYGGACCPTGLNCGTVIGDSEVPVCCPPGNPDCRGDVEGLWPQVCADSAWALWHVNTNGNQFCCLPDQIGYNIPNNNAAVGFCGSAVPAAAMRSILDYVGDNSTAGNFLSYPCDTNIPPNSTWGNMTSSILNSSPTLNPTGLPLATGVILNGTSNSTTMTIAKPWQETTYVHPPGSSQTVAIIHSLSSGIPITTTSTMDVPAYIATPSEVNVIFQTTVNGTSVVKTSASVTPSEANVLYATTVNGTTIATTSTSAVSGAAGGTGSSGASGTLAVFTGSALKLGGSLTTLGIGAAIAALLLH